MDEATIRQYDLTAEKIALFHSSIAPTRLYELAKLYFSPGALTLDVGCGIGRDCNWLLNNGFPSYGVDASYQMLLSARAKYSNLQLIVDYLPNLASIKDSAFENLFCSAVLMHLPVSVVLDALRALWRILCVNGTLILSYRCSVTGTEREAGKLYSKIDKEQLIFTWRLLGGLVLLTESLEDSLRPIIWENIVFRKIS